MVTFDNRVIKNNCSKHKHDQGKSSNHINYLLRSCP